MKAKLVIEIEFVNWHEDGKGPQTKEEWADFFLEHYLPEGCVFGEGEDNSIAVDDVTIECTEIQQTPHDEGAE